MSTELNLSVGKSPRFFVRLDGWKDDQIAQLVHATRGMFGVLTAAASAGSGMYVDFDDAATTESHLQGDIRNAAAAIMPGRISPA